MQKKNKKVNTNTKKKKLSKKTNKNIIIVMMFISIVSLIILMISSTHSVLVTRKNSDEKNLQKTKNINLTLFDEESTVINLSNELPVQDEFGKKNKPYKFSISGTNNNYYTKYKIILIPQDNTTIPLEYIKIQVNDNVPVLFTSFSDYVVDSGYLNIGEIKDYEIRLWIDFNSDNDVENKIFSAKLVVVGEAVKNNPETSGNTTN